MSKELAELIEFYRTDPQAFIEDVLYLEPTEQQQKIIEAIKWEEKFISVKSGHGTGKSTIVAAFALWFLCCYHSQIIITAPSSTQLFDALWSRLAGLFEKMNPVFKESFSMLADRIFSKANKKTHFIAARTAKKEAPENLQGFHAENLLIIADEASGIDDEIWEVLLGALTEDNNILICIGNPLRNTGFFHNTFTKNHDGTWHNLTFSSEDSPLVKQEYIDEMAKHGRDSNKFRVRVLGEFPKVDADSLIPYDMLETAQTRSIEASGSIVWGVDVARFGSDSSVLLKRQGRKVIEYKKVEQFDVMEVAGIVAHEYTITKPEERPEMIFIDSIGLGAGAYDRLNELELPVKAVNVSSKSHKPKDYRNLRAEIYDKVREWFVDFEPEIPNSPDILAELADIKYKFSSNGSMIIEEKELYKRRNGHSPDIADALSLTFASDNLVELNILFV